MSFRWPWLLTGLVIVPVAIAAYIWSERRKRKYAVPFASLALIRDAVPRRSRWRRHLPVALMLAAIAVLIVAAARPQTSVPVAHSRTSIILTLDVSGSMCSTDVDPNRLTAAETAAEALVKKEGGAVRIGIVEFSGAANVLVPPTTDTKKLLDALDGLTVGRGTAIGTAILAAIDAISGVNPDVAPSTVDVSAAAGTPSTPDVKYSPDIVVLLTDGANNRGVDPMVAAGQAADRKVRVYTIGFGTDHPGSLACTSEQLGPDPFGPFGGGGGFGGPGPGGYSGGPAGSSGFLNEDQQALENIAARTGARAFRAESAQQLLDVFRKLPARIRVQHETREVSVGFLALGVVLAVLAVALSLRWNRFP